MSLLVTGSIGIDSVETPAGKAENVLGGSAVYFSLAASLYSPTRMVAVVGEDFDHNMFEPLKRRPIDLSGVEVRRGSHTFRWAGRYEGAMNAAETVDVKLNVLAEPAAPVPSSYLDSRYIFLANTHPSLQLEFAERFRDAQFIMADTMDFWIKQERDALGRTLKRVDGLVLNEGEATLLTGHANLVAAGREILKLGPRVVIIKKGENGALLFTPDEVAVTPAFPTDRVVDPTGCGDTFAGAVMGYLAASGRHDAAAIRSAMVRGAAAASIVLESFSVHASANATRQQVESRVEMLRRLMTFE
jgi:sugar/nucleoside kinase (ribokinase family)